MWLEKTCQSEDSETGTRETDAALDHKGDLNRNCNVLFL